MQQYTTDLERVAYLIDSYREEIGGANSKNAKTIRDYIEDEEKKQYATIDERIANGEDVRHLHLVVDYPMELEYKTWTNEQLLGHFYSKIAGTSADNNVLQQLLPDYYDTTFFSEEEETFLTTHFVEVVNYIIETSYISLHKYSDLRELHLLSPELLDLVKTEFAIPEGATIYNPYTGFAQFSQIFKRNKFVCEESYTVGENRSIKDDANWLWAWMKVALFANTIDAEIIEDNRVPSSYDYAISYIPYTIDSFNKPNVEAYKSVLEEQFDRTIISKIQLAYHNLSNKGKMLLIIPDYLLWKTCDNYPMDDLWSQIINDGALTKIIHLPPTCVGLNYNYCILIIHKGSKTNDVLMVDVRFATKNANLRIIELEDYLDVMRKNEQKPSGSILPSGYRSVFIDGNEKLVEEYDTPFSQTIDLDMISKMVSNNGKDPNTGLRKMVTISYKDLNPDLLLPEVYVAERPQNGIKTIPLSELCTFVPTIIRDLEYDLPFDTPWIKDKNLDYTFQGPLDMLNVDKSECPNNPHQTSDYLFDSNEKLLEGYPWYQPTLIGRRVLKYRESTFLEANKDAVLIKLDMKGNPFAILNRGEKPVAISKSIMVFCPKCGVQLTTLVAVLKMPIVYNQVLSFAKFGLSRHLNDIKVPFDKWLIDNEVTRYVHENETINYLKNDYENIKKSVRMRKHALTQSLSSLHAMFNALNAYRIRKGGHIADDEIISRVKGTKVYEAFEYLSRNLKDMMPVIEHIADIDYSFAKSEWIDPESFIDTYISKKGKGWINFSAITTWDKNSNKAKNDIIDPSTGVILFKRGEVLNQFLFPQDALERILDNIVSNAMSHGFNKSRSNYQIRFSWFTENKAIKLLIENNGTPIPDDRNPASLLEYGVSTELHSNGHYGIGCNEIDDIMQRYDGKVEIISSPLEEYTVKYMLTFYRSDSVY